VTIDGGSASQELLYSEKHSPPVPPGAATVQPFSGSFTIGARLRVVLASSWRTIQSFERLI
jgi:hypothetical protein